MNCADCDILLHALVDDELDAGHAREIEAHVQDCPACTEKLAALRALRAAMAAAKLKETAPAGLRSRIEAALPAAPAAPAAAATAPAPRRLLAPSRRNFFGGFAAGAVLSGAVAASLMLAVFREDGEQLLAGDVVTAHLRSLQPGHLTDVQTSDQHTVKPWFNGKLDIAPPVIDLTAQGFTLIGGRLDDLNGAPAAAIVYQRRKHVINLFVAPAQGAAAGDSPVADSTIQGFNVRHWRAGGLDYWAVSDLAADELDDFVDKIVAAVRSPSGPA